MPGQPPPAYPMPYGGPPMPPAYGGYGPPPGMAGPGITAPDDSTWALMAYVGQFIIGFIAPLIVYLSRKDQSPFVRAHAVQALNLAITSFIVVFGGMVIGFVTVFFGFIVTLPVMLVYGVAHLIYLILAAIKAGQSQPYQIPTWLCWPMIR